MTLDKTKWIKTLKSGDEVAYLKKTMSGVMWRIAIIEKVTPSGRLNLPHGLIVNPDGHFRGDKHRKIYPVTEEIRAEMKKVELLANINRQLNTVDLTNATAEQLTKVYESLATLPIKR